MPLMDGASMLSLKRRLSSLSLRQKALNEYVDREAPDSTSKADFIKAALPDSQQPLAQQRLPQSSGTITPLINGIRDIIEDVLPMPSARHVPPDLQRRLSTLSSAPLSQFQQPSATRDSRQAQLQVDPNFQTADVLVIEDGPVVPTGEAIAVRGRREPASHPVQDEGPQQVLTSEKSLVWDLPHPPSTSSSRPHTQGASRPHSSVLTPGSSAVRPRPEPVQKKGKSGKAECGPGPFSAASSAQGFDTSAQVLKLDQLCQNRRAGSAVVQDEQRAGQPRRRSAHTAYTYINADKIRKWAQSRPSLVHLQQRQRERHSSTATGPHPEEADKVDQSIASSSPSSGPKYRAAAEVPGSGKAPKWKQQSAQLRLAMQANKGGSRAEAAAAMLAKTHQASLVPCPHCGRSFSEVAAERHIPKCQDNVHKPSRLVAGGGTGAHQRVQRSRRS